MHLCRFLSFQNLMQSYEKIFISIDFPKDKYDATLIQVEGRITFLMAHHYRDFAKFFGDLFRYIKK